MDLQSILKGLPFIIAFLVTVCGIKTFFNRKKVKMLLAYINHKGFIKIETQNCYYSGVGLKKEYPSFPSKMTIYITDDEAVFIGVSKFPFIFNTFYIPFVLSKDPIVLKSSLSFSRNFKPEKIVINRKSISLHFTDNLSINTKIEYQFDLKHETDTDSFRKIANWC